VSTFTSPATAPVDANLAAYTAEDVDALATTFAEGIKLGAFAQEAAIVGIEACREAYARTIKAYPMSGTTAIDRIVVGTTIIDQEESLRTDGAKRFMGTIYETKDGKITRIQTISAKAEPIGVAIAQAQLESYNVQDLDGHVACFAENVTVRNLNEEPNLTGRDAYRDRMGGVFTQFPHNRVELLGRIAVGNVVIDHEKVMRSPEVEPFEVAAIYTIDADGLIGRVDFVR
jgi:hypothetical protein